MSHLALNAISITVGLFFVFFGILKITPLISDDLYRDMRKLFIKTAHIFPLSAYTGWYPNPHTFRRFYGAMEIVCGLLLAVCPGPVKDVCNALLICLMLLTLHGAWSLDQGLKEASHSMVFGLLLTCRLIIRLQVYHREKNEQQDCEKFIREQRIQEKALLTKHLADALPLSSDNGLAAASKKKL